MRHARFLAAGLLGAWSLSGHAADEKAKEPGPAEDSLAASKRELESLKDDHLRSGTAPRVDLPADIGVASLPDLRLAPELEDARKKQQELLRKKAKSSNWLVDGVQKTTSTRDAVGRTSGKDADLLGGAQEDSNDFVLDPTTGKPVAIAGPTSKSRDAEKPARGDRTADDKAPKEAPPDNPLNRYMGDWMTSRDFALLKPAGDTSSTTRLDGAAPDLTARGAPDSGSFFQNSVPTSQASGLSASAVPGTGPMTRDNPYLQSLSLPAPVATSSFSLDSGPSNVTPSAPATLSPSFVPSAPLPESKPTYPMLENLKRSDDAKYFPQLKRF